MPTPITSDAPAAGSGTAPAAEPAGTRSAADPADAPPVPVPVPAPGQASVPVPVGRAQIDALDQQIAELIQRRIEVSRTIQAARIADGGRRIDLRRESEIIGRYRAALGKQGTSIAMALLELCRGRA